MDVADACARECKACLEGRGEHLLTGFHVVSVIVCALEVLEDSDGRFLGETDGFLGVISPADICLDCVGECVHTGRGGRFLRQIARELRIEYCIFRHKAQIHYRVLVMGLGVGDDCGYRSLRTGAGSRRDRDEGGYLMPYAQETRHFVYRSVRVNHSCSRALGSVHRGAAADSEETVASGFEIELLDSVNDRYRGVCRDLGIVLVSDARLVEGSLRNGCYGLSYGSTGYDHDLFNALFFKQLWHLTQRTLALNGYRLAPVKAARADIEYRLKCAVISFF